MWGIAHLVGRDDWVRVSANTIYTEYTNVSTIAKQLHYTKRYMQHHETTNNSD